MRRIFISYRREDSGAAAGRLHDRLREHFGRDNIFMDIDAIEPGLDFTEAIERTVASCDILIALIGRQWLMSTDATGRRRLDNPEDLVRQEIAAALQRNIRVIPALIQGTAMPRAADLPDDLQPLARRNAVELSDARFHRDVDLLIEVLDRVLEVAPSPLSPAGPPRVQSSYLRSWKFWGLACLIFVGIAFIVAPYVIPQLKLLEKPPGPGPDAVLPPPGPPVQSYRLITNLYSTTIRLALARGFSNVEFSIFVNGVPVGVYSSEGVKADISRFIKPGENKVRITWTADPNMTSDYVMELRIEAKQGEAWNPLITRRVDRKTQAGETLTTIVHHGDTPR